MVARVTAVSRLADRPVSGGSWLNVVVVLALCMHSLFPNVVRP